MDVRAYIANLAASLEMSDQDCADALAKSERIGAWLRQRLPHVDEVRSFGSMTRRTSLATLVHGERDVDVILRIDDGITRYAGEVGPADALGACLEELRTTLSANPACSRVAVNRPCLNFEFEQQWFELVPSFHGEEDGNYVFELPIDEWEFAHWERMQPYLGPGVTPAGGETGTNPGTKIIASDPWQLTRIVPQYERVYDFAWRHLVLLLKYWKHIHRLPLPSYVLEFNVMKGLQAGGRFSECHTLFDLLTVFLGDETLYDAALLHEVPDFGLLQRAVRNARRLDNQGETEGAAYFMVLLMPPPAMLAKADPSKVPDAARTAAVMDEMEAGYASLLRTSGAAPPPTSAR
jgi:hypothetical protein